MLSTSISNGMFNKVGSHQSRWKGIDAGMAVCAPCGSGCRGGRTIETLGAGTMNSGMSNAR